MNETHKPRRIVELDALRGIAAFGVMLYHYTAWYNQLYKHLPGVLFYFPKGKYGVELFFIISGFVIFMTLERVKTGSDFIIGRCFRLFPAYWSAIIITFTVVFIVGLPGLEVKLHEALINLTMLQSFFNVPHVDQVYWTLELELSFYAIMFVFYKLKLLASIEKLAMGWLSVIALSVIYRHYLSLEINPRIELFLLLNSANLFIIGLMFYKIYKKGASPTRYAIIAASLIVYRFQHPDGDPQSLHSWAEFLILTLWILLFKLVLDNKMRFFRLKIFVFVGTISYSLYLIHENIGYVIIRYLSNLNINPNVSIIVAILVAIVLASMIIFLVEKPVMHIAKERYLASKVKT